MISFDTRFSDNYTIEIPRIPDEFNFNSTFSNKREEFVLFKVG